MRDLSFVLDLDGLEAIVGNLPGKCTELVDEPDEGLQTGRLLRANGGHIEGVGNSSRQQVVRHLLSDLQGDVFLRLIGARAEMRRGDEIWRAEQHAVFGRLGNKYIETGGGDVPALERRAQGRLIDEPASGRVHDDDASLGLGQCLRRQDIFSLVRQRRVQRNQIGASQQIVQLDLFHAELDRALRREKWIVGDYLHFESQRPFRDERAVTAAADIVVTGATSDGNGVEAFGQKMLQPSGRKTVLSYRGGLDYELGPGRFRVRAGAYWEPSRFDGVDGRVHLTFGGDLRVFEFHFFGLRRGRISLTGDAARGYRNVGFSIITDMCLPDALEPAKLEDIIATANAAEKKLRVLVRRLIKEI